MNTSIPFLIFFIIVAVVIVELVRRKAIREKYAALWLIISLLALLLASWPQLLEAISTLLGVKTPANLLFSLSILLLMGVSLHLSWELSRSEDRVRILAEEIALTKMRVELLESEDAKKKDN